MAEMLRFQTTTVVCGAVDVVVDIWEPRQGTTHDPILLIHGWGGTGSYWHSTAQHLSETARVFVPDLPGTGRSQPVASPRDFFDQVDTLCDLLDALDLSRVQVVGHSMGSAMALVLADRRPERVSRLVLTSLCFFVNGFQENVYRAVMQVFKLSMAFRPDWLASVPGMPHMMATRYFHRVPDDKALLRQGLLDYLHLDAKTATACADDATTKAIPEAGARVQVPTLLVVCRQDKVMPAQNVDFTVETIPNCELIWIDQSGHFPMLERPDIYFDVLDNFLALGQ